MQLFECQCGFFHRLRCIVLIVYTKMLNQWFLSSYSWYWCFQRSGHLWFTLQNNVLREKYNFRKRANPLNRFLREFERGQVVLAMSCNAWATNCMKVYYRAVSLLSRVTTLFKVVKLWSMEENIEDSSLLKSVSVEAT